MGGGDLNMKKSWHPVLLVNQERVWKAEKAANEEKKKLAQLRKEQEEERQLAELQRLQEQSTGKKRVDRLDWLYAAPSNEGGALGNAKISQSQMEDYLLGKRRVDEALSGGDKNVGNLDKEFIAVQNANSARDTAAKIREDPLLAIRRQEQEAMKALANRPDIRRQLKAARREGSESKEERKARKKAEKEERRRERHEKRRRRHDDEWSPRSDYSDDERDRRRRSDERRYRDRSRSYSPRRRYRDDYDRDVSPKRERDSEERRYRDRSDDYSRHRDRSPRRHRDDSPRKSSHSGDRVRLDRKPDVRDREEEHHNSRPSRNGDDRGSSSRPQANGHAHSNGYTNGDHRQGANGVRPHPSRPNALDMADRPTSSSTRQGPQTTNGAASSSSNGHVGNPNTQNLDDMRAARLAAMSASAHDLQASRNKSLAQRAEEERREAEKDERLRAKYGKDVANAGFFNSQGEMGLGEALQRRAGKGLQRERDL